MKINIRDWRIIILISVVFYVLWMSFLVYPQGLKVQEMQQELNEKRLKLSRAQFYPVRERQLDSAISQEKTLIEELSVRLYSYTVIANLLKDIEDVSKKYGMEVLSISGPNKLEDRISFNFSLKGNYTKFVPWAYELSMSKTLNITQLNAKIESDEIIYSGVLEITPFQEVKVGQ
ncbi:MAG TPA: hypothetical protein PK811_08985 [bacterium]|nr:hypothetical protein [bacterium]